VHENLVFVRPSSVRIIITFCEGDLGGGTRAAVYWYFELLILKDPKSEHLSKSLRAGIGRFRDPFLDLDLVTFWQEVSKNVIARKSPYQGIDSSSNQCSWSDVRGRGAKRRTSSVFSREMSQDPCHVPRTSLQEH
jgi:hypothetical protein